MFLLLFQCLRWQTRRTGFVTHLAAGTALVRGEFDGLKRASEVSTRPLWRSLRLRSSVDAIYNRYIIVPVSYRFTYY